MAATPKPRPPANRSRRPDRARRARPRIRDCSGSKRRSRRRTNSSKRSGGLARKADGEGRPPEAPLGRASIGDGDRLAGENLAGARRRRAPRRGEPGANERWPAIVIALQKADALAMQDRRRLRGFDALRDGMQPEPVGETEQMAQEHL